MTSIGELAFNGCIHLISVTIPDGVTCIEDRVFMSCNSLTSVIIGNSVASIGDYAFYQCFNLTSITIPNSVTSIGESAFRYCNLNTVVSQIEAPFDSEGKSSVYKAFSEEVFDNATLYVPKGLVDLYKETEGWKDFQYIKESDGTDDTDGIANVKNQPMQIQAHKGVLSIEGVAEGTKIGVYNAAGRLVGKAKASAGATIISTQLHEGEVGIVKIGERSLKLRMTP